MRLSEIFAKDIQRPIEGVIKADDVAHLGTEVEEYVLTSEAAKGLEILLEEYTSYTNANGVWISGFFGSGKSHMLKMLAHLLGDVEGQDYPRQNVSDSFRAKSPDAFLPGLLNKADRIPAKSLLFNIDQKATLISKDQSDALFKVFVKVFDESRGYYGNQGHVARFERDLDERGQFGAFKEAFQRIAGVPWAIGREQSALEGPSIDRAFAEVNGKASEGIIKQYSASYAVSIEDFADEVKRWLDKQEDPNFRLNFFVDEVGQFIGADTKLMLDLQTIAESLNTRCAGRSWVSVTSQEDMEKVIGDRTKQQGNDFSKIQARFKTRLKLSSANVDEVIRKRLLEKNDAGTAALGSIYADQHANFKTLFDFVDGYSPLGATFSFVASNPTPTVSYSDPLPGVVNSYTGSNPAQWFSGIPLYGAATVTSMIYPGITAQYAISATGAASRLNLTLAAGVDPKAITFQIAAQASQIVVASDGSLDATIGTPSTAPSLSYPPPSASQGSVSRTASYVLQSATTFGLAVQDLDSSQPLQISILLNAAASPNSAPGFYVSAGLLWASDASSNLYYATTIADAAGKPAPFSLADEGCGMGIGGPIPCQDVAIYKFSAAGALEFITILSGRTMDSPSFIGLTPTGALAVAGSTDSSDFPVSPGAFQTAYAGPPATWATSAWSRAILAATLDPTTGKPEASTSLGGPNADALGTAAIGPNGSLYLLPALAGTHRRASHDERRIADRLPEQPGGHQPLRERICRAPESRPR